MRTPAGTVDLTPTWVGVLPIYITALTEGTPKGQQMAQEELRFMARVADLFNELASAAEGLANDTGNTGGVIDGYRDAVREVLAKAAKMKAER